MPRSHHAHLTFAAVLLLALAACDDEPLILTQGTPDAGAIPSDGAEPRDGDMREGDAAPLPDTAVVEEDASVPDAADAAPIKDAAPACPPIEEIDASVNFDGATPTCLDSWPGTNSNDGVGELTTVVTSTRSQAAYVTYLSDGSTQLWLTEMFPPPLPLPVPRLLHSSPKLITKPVLAHGSGRTVIAWIELVDIGGSDQWILYWASIPTQGQVIPVEIDRAVWPNTAAMVWSGEAFVLYWVRTSGAYRLEYAAVAPDGSIPQRNTAFTAPADHSIGPPAAALKAEEIAVVWVASENVNAVPPYRPQGLYLARADTTGALLVQPRRIAGAAPTQDVGHWVAPVLHSVPRGYVVAWEDYDGAQTLIVKSMLIDDLCGTVGPAYELGRPGNIGSLVPAVSSTQRGDRLGVSWNANLPATYLSEVGLDAAPISRICVDDSPFDSGTPYHSTFVDDATGDYAIFFFRGTDSGTDYELHFATYAP